MIFFGALFNYKKKPHFLKNQQRDHPYLKNFEMLYDHTFQHRAKISILVKKFKFLTTTLKLTSNVINSKLPISQLTRKKISLSKKGKKRGGGIAFKISNSLRGRFFSDKHKNNLKRALSGFKNPMFGRFHSKYVKRRISKGLIKKNPKSLVKNF
jgi:hypothetical protein|mmetsp:Transcript_40641/g.59828  ORF Transcript_40641/g.59828 Transcript_40641/m.59828 type:complete len:154 (-) Transcript_40641:697-1158(-)